MLPVIRNNVYHPAFAGSYSLKYVLPALVPRMTYDGMEVANGRDAGLAWESLVPGILDQPEQTAHGVVGDMLTTSATSGFAMRASDPSMAFGAVIGKALAGLDRGCGLIPILVTLQ